MALRSVSTSELRRELARRERGASKLHAVRVKLAARLAQLESELASLGLGAPKRRGRPPGRKSGRRGPGRPKGSRNKPRARRASNSLSLAEAVSKVVAVGKTVSPAEVMVAVRRIYKSSSKNLGMMVANTLAKHPEFKRLGRGQYVRKGGGKRGRPAKAKRGRPAKRTPRKRASKGSKPQMATRSKPRAAQHATPRAAIAATTAAAAGAAAAAAG